MKHAVWRGGLERCWALALPLGLSLTLAACGGDDDAEWVGYQPATVNPAVSRLLSGVDAIGTGGADLLTHHPAYADLELSANRSGGTVQLRFSCSGCDITVSAAGSSVGANQYLSVAVPSLDASGDVPVTVTDKTSGQVATYTLRARPLDHAPYTVGVNSNPEAGDLYLTPFDPDGYGPSFAYLVGTDGKLKYYYRSPPGKLILDFKKTVIGGGATRYSFYDEAAAAIRVMDASFNTLTLVQALPFPDGNTYAIDGHDHVIVDDGHYLVGVSAAKTVNNIPSQPGRSLFVKGAGLQEIVNGAATFSWLSTDHPELYACSSAYNDYASNNGADYAHWTSLQVDGDGHWLAAFRHLNAVLKIRPGDGGVSWILGGLCDQFALDASQKFTAPHDARRRPDGRLGLFDVGAVGVLSRAVAFDLDEAAKTVLGFTAYTTDAHASYNLGSAQWFASGRALVGWGEFNGAASDLTEYDTATGAASFKLTLQPSPWTYGYFSYRAVKAP